MSISDFKALFKSNERSFGRWIPETGECYTEKGTVRDIDITAHFDGKTGLGLVPICDDNNCWWGAIDIDNHDGSNPIDHKSLVKKIHDMGIPLIVCESKSGDAHAYLFASEPLPAQYIRRLLSKWALELGYRGAEIFPKQSILGRNKDGLKILGNWINLPYFKLTERRAIAIQDNQFVKLTFENFIKAANFNKINKDTLEHFLLLDYREAPPCIHSMLLQGVAQGYRNEGLYNLTIYFKKAYPDDFKERVQNVNDTVFDKPLPFVEAKKTIQSAASNKDYRYKCLQEPCRSYCNSELCVTREFGISREDMGFLARVEMPQITDIKIYDMDPPLWEMKLDGVKITLNTDQLYNYNSFAKVVMEKMLVMIPPMKAKDWANTLAGYMETVERVETPENASTPGIIKDRLIEFLSKADLTNNGLDKMDRMKLVRGLPVVQLLSLEKAPMRYVIFRGNDFVMFLKRMKAEELRGSHLWNSLRNFGVGYSRIRLPDSKVLQIWCVPIDEKNRTKLDSNYLDDNDDEAMEEPKNEFEFKSEF